MVRLCGIWRNVDKEGQEYFGGTLGGARVVMLPNKHKTKPGHPDFTLYIDEQQPREGR